MSDGEILVLRGDIGGKEFTAFFIPDIGCAEVSLAGDCAGLRRLWVRPEMRRKGYGSQLLSAACEEAKLRGKLALSWSVLKRSVGEVAFYECRHCASVVHDDGEEYWMAISFSTKTGAAECTPPAFVEHAPDGDIVHQGNATDEEAWRLLRLKESQAHRADAAQIGDPS